jgi:hypothetical protein
MPKAPSPPLPEIVTSGQIARLVGVTERTINARRLDGRLVTVNGGIDLVALARAGLTAGLAGTPRERLSREVFSFAHYTACHAAAAAVTPRPGEAAEQAAARGMRHAMEGDDTFLEPRGWQWEDRLNLLDYVVPAEDEPAEDEAAA